MRCRVTATAVLVAVGAPEIHAQNVHEHRLSNGLLVLALPSPRGQLDVAAAYFVGARNDPPGLEGMAHVVEHITMRGTKRGVSIAAELQRRGFDVGASTNAHITVFSASARTSSAEVLRTWFQIEQLRMTDVTFDSTALDVERRRVGVETAARNRSARNSHAGLDRITVDEAFQLYEGHYVASNAMLVVASTLPHDTVFRMAEAVFGSVPLRPVPARISRSTSPTVRGSTISALIECEAGGGWRICLTATAPAEIASDRPSWKTPVVQSSGWEHVGRRRWLSADGGANDSSYIGVQVILADTSLSASDVAALEVLARTFHTVRIGDTALGDSLKRLGATVAITSLPYPPLATADAFRMIGTPVTPVGAVGLQMIVAMPQGHVRAALQLVRATSLELDSSAITAEISRQRKLIADAAVAPSPQLEVLFRQTLPVPSGIVMPRDLAAQQRVMEELMVADVARVYARIKARGEESVVLLGGAPQWIQEGQEPDTLEREPEDALATPPSQRNCPPAESAIADLSVAADRTDLYFAICIPASGVNAAAALAVMNAMIGGREDAVIAQRLRSETGLVYDFESRVVPIRGARAHLWYLRVGTRAEYADSAVAEVKRLLHSWQVSARALNDFRSWFVRRQRDRTADGTRWVSHVLTFGTTPESNIAETEAVTLADVETVRAYFSTARLRVTRLRQEQRR
jgi:predicted Zn-dependent peptidase